MRQVGEEEEGASPRWKPKGRRALGRPPRSCQISQPTPAAKGREQVVPTGLSSKVRRPGKVSVSDTKKRSGSQKEKREGMVTMAAGATKCPLDWPPAVTRDGGKIGRYSNGCHLGHHPPGQGWGGKRQQGVGDEGPWGKSRREGKMTGWGSRGVRGGEGRAGRTQEEKTKGRRQEKPLPQSPSSPPPTPKVKNRLCGERETE